MGKILLEEQSAPSTPSANHKALYVDSVDGRVKAKDDAGNVVDLETGTNPFDQTLNTTDEVTFADVNITGMSGNVITTDNVETSIEELDESIYRENRTGLGAWDVGTTYYQLSGGFPTPNFQVLRGGYGFINGKKITWTAPQTTTALAANTTNYIYCDTDGVVKASTSFPSGKIRLFETLNDGAVNLTVREDHPYNFDSAVASFLHQTTGTILALASGTTSIGGTLEKKGTTTGASVDDRKLIMQDSVRVVDHGITSNYTGSTTPIVWNFMYLNGSGKWIRYSADSEIPMVYSNAGTITAIPSGKVSAMTFYMGKDDLNSSNPTFYAVVEDHYHDTVSEEVQHINDGSFGVITNELRTLEPARLGFVVIVNSGGGYIDTVLVSKNQVFTDVQDAKVVHPLDEIVFGTGTSISSSPSLKWVDASTALEVSDPTKRSADKTYIQIENDGSLGSDPVQNIMKIEAGKGYFGPDELEAAGMQFTHSASMGGDATETVYRFKGATSAKDIVLRDGKLGIGINYPSNPLEVYSATSAFGRLHGDSTVGLLLRRASTDASNAGITISKQRGTIASPSIVANVDVLGSILFTGYDGSNNIGGALIGALVEGTPGTNDMPACLVFQTTNDGSSVPTEKMRITNGGFVGINKADPKTYLDVNAPNNSADGATAIFRNAGTVSTGWRSSIYFGDTNTTTSSNRYGRIANVYEASGELGLRFSTYTGSSSNVDAMILKSSGQLGFAGNVPVTTGNNYGQIQLPAASTSGIYLGNTANSAANVLDWYEEGSFTPVLAGTSTAGAGTYSTQYGRYVRIGSVVHYQISIITSAHTGTGNGIITGLPFTSGNFNSAVAPVYHSNYNLTNSNTNMLWGRIAPNTTTIILEETQDSVTVIASALDAAATITITGNYMV